MCYILRSFKGKDEEFALLKETAGICFINLWKKPLDEYRGGESIDCGCMAKENHFI